MYMHINGSHLTVSSVLTIVNGSSRASAAERGHTQVRSYIYDDLFMFTHICVCICIYMYIILPFPLC